MAAAPSDIQQQMQDNVRWIREAKANKLVVGSQARILYADAQGRAEIASAFNDAIKDGHHKGPVVLGRDTHDVSGTDSPYRETSNIYDGSAFTADGCPKLRRRRFRRDVEACTTAGASDGAR